MFYAVKNCRIFLNESGLRVLQDERTIAGMPDVTRSDSQRSDTLRPRVSFNRDVHVKRIGTKSNKNFENHFLIRLTTYELTLLDLTALIRIKTETK